MIAKAGEDTATEFTLCLTQLLASAASPMPAVAATQPAPPNPGGFEKQAGASQRYQLSALPASTDLYARGTRALMFVITSYSLVPAHRAKSSTKMRSPDWALPRSTTS